MTKLINLLELKKRIGNKREKKFIVTCGFFDFIEPWHIDLFDFAKRHGDILSVIIFQNESQIPVEEKQEILSAIDVIDHISIAKEDKVEEVFSQLEGIDVLVLNREINPNIKTLSLKYNIKQYIEKKKNLKPYKPPI